MNLEFEEIMLSCNFNQTKSLISVGTENGFRVYKISSIHKSNINNQIENYQNDLNIENDKDIQEDMQKDKHDTASTPYLNNIYKDETNLKEPLALTQLEYYEKKLEGGLSIVELYYESNIVILVGGGKYPAFPKNKVILWDEEHGVIVNELTFNSFIKNVKLKKDIIFIACESKIHVLNLLSFRAIDILDISSSQIPNKGLLTINYSLDDIVLAFPDKTLGLIIIKNYQTGGTVLLKAHNSQILNMQLSEDGTMLASVSAKCRLVKVFRSIDGMLLAKYKRHNNNSKVCYICFDINCLFLLVNSSDGLIEVFSLDTANKNNTLKEIDEKFLGINNKFSSFKNKEHLVEIEENDDKSRLPINEELSYSKFRIKESKSISSFLNQGRSIGVISSEGIYYQANIEPESCHKTLEVGLNLIATCK